MNTETYNQQIAGIQSQLAQMQRAFPQANPVQFSPIHTILPVDNIAGAEAILKEMPAGSSDIVAHSTEDIIYILARNKDGVPLPIKTAKIEFIEPQQDPSGYVTRADFDAFKDELKAILTRKGEQA